VLFDWNTGGITIGINSPVPFNQAAFLVGTAISKTNNTTFTVNSTGVYRVTYSVRTAAVSALGSTQVRVNGVGVGPSATLIGAGASLTDMITFPANAADTIQVVVGGLSLTLATGDNATINQAFSLGGLDVRRITLITIVVALLALGALALLLARTRIGLQMRAAAIDFRTARLLGVRANAVISVAVLLSGLLAALVAVILTVQQPFVSPDFALKDTIVVLVGVVVGGMNRLWTATLGGFAIGFASGVIYGALPTDKTAYLPSVLFALVIVVLLVRPAGLFAPRGTSTVERV